MLKEGQVLKPLRLRLRTFMVVIAGLALLMAISPRRVRIMRVAPGKFSEAETVLTVGRELRTRVGQTFDSDGVLREEVFQFIPVEFIAIPIVMMAGSVGIVLCSSSLREGRDLRVMAAIYDRIPPGQRLCFDRGRSSHINPRSYPVGDMT